MTDFPIEALRLDSTSRLRAGSVFMGIPSLAKLAELGGCCGAGFGMYSSSLRRFHIGSCLLMMGGRTAFPLQAPGSRGSFETSILNAPRANGNARCRAQGPRWHRFLGSPNGRIRADRGGWSL